MFNLSQFSSYGAGGARRPSPCCSGAAGHLVAELLRSGVPASSVLTSCGSGAPSLVRAAFPGCRVFRASDFPGLGRAAFAARAAALVRGLSDSPSPLWVCFPGCGCPPSVAPSRRWVSCGSGSWSECSLAAGLGVAVLVFLPAGILPPPSFGAWSVCCGSPLGAGGVGGSWWFLAPPASLF